MRRSPVPRHKEPWWPTSGRIPDLTPAGHRLATFVIDHPHYLIHLTVPRRSRAHRNLGGQHRPLLPGPRLRGFQGLKIRLAAEATAETHSPFQPGLTLEPHG